MKSHVTLQHAVPTHVRIEPLLSSNKIDKFKFYQKKWAVHCIYKENDKWLAIDINLNKINKHKDKFIIWFENYSGVFYSWSAVEDLLEYQNEIIGTDDVIYFDEIESCGQDFTYESPYIHYVYQPMLKNDELYLRKKFADCFQIEIHVGELENKLYRDIQRLAIKKYNISAKVINKIPIKLYNAQLHFYNYIDFSFSQEFKNKSFVNNMTMHEKKSNSIFNWHKKSYYYTAKSLDEVDNLLSDYNNYIQNILPKLRLAW
jgi:hypothetical protein